MARSGTAILKLVMTHRRAAGVRAMLAAACALACVPQAGAVMVNMETPTQAEPPAADAKKAGEAATPVSEAAPATPGATPATPGAAANPATPGPASTPTAPSATPVPARVASMPPSEDYVLVWTDEFDGKVLDEKKWSFSGLGPRRDAVVVKDAVSLDGQGNLVITTSRGMAKQADGTEKSEIRTGLISTLGRFETTYGYFEIRMKPQRQIGHWSAFWINTPTMGVPMGDPAKAGVEINVVEHLRNADNADKVHHSIIWDSKPPQSQRDSMKISVPGINEGFHAFGCEWTPEAIVFFVDGKETWRTSKAIPKRDQYLVISLEVGKWAGEIGEAALPDSLVVDHVRVFKKRAEVETRPVAQPADVAGANPATAPATTAAPAAPAAQPSSPTPTPAAPAPNPVPAPAPSPDPPPTEPPK
jgi:beta-glucanase (GH16 family)